MFGLQFLTLFLKWLHSQTPWFHCELESKFRILDMRMIRFENCLLMEIAGSFSSPVWLIFNIGGNSPFFIFWKFLLPELANFWCWMTWIFLFLETERMLRSCILRQFWGHVLVFCSLDSDFAYYKKLSLNIYHDVLLHDVHIRRI